MTGKVIFEGYVEKAAVDCSEMTSSLKILRKVKYDLEALFSSGKINCENDCVH